MKYKIRKANAEVSTLVTTIPKWIVNKLNLKDKDLVNIDLQGKKIIITKEEKQNVEFIRNISFWRNNHKLFDNNNNFIFSNTICNISTNWI